MVFHCHHDFSLDTKCEWTFLTSFVAQYNKEHKTDFQRFRCLDVELRNTAKPEVLLVDSSNGNTMVIERKSIVWPSIYIADHKAWHRKAERLAKANNGYFEEFLPWDDKKKLMGQRKDAVQGFSQAFGSTLPVVADKFANGLTQFVSTLFSSLGKRIVLRMMMWRGLSERPTCRRKLTKCRAHVTNGKTRKNTEWHGDKCGDKMWNCSNV